VLQPERHKVEENAESLHETRRGPLCRARLGPLGVFAWWLLIGNGCAFAAARWLLVPNGLAFLGPGHCNQFEDSMLSNDEAFPVVENN
jgi:hypothetical protein